MGVKETSAPLTVQIPKSIRVGDMAARLVYKGEASGNDALYSVVIGDVANTDFGFSEEHGFPTVAIGAAAKIEVEDAVFIPSNLISLVTQGGMRTLATQFHNQAMLLRNLVTDISAIEEAAYALADNTKHAEEGYEWEISVLGTPALRAVQRSLFVAAGNDNSQLNIKNPNITDSEKRAEKLSTVAEAALYAFMFMPLEPRQ